MEFRPPAHPAGSADPLSGHRSGGLDGFRTGSQSFTDFLGSAAPHLLPGAGTASAPMPAASGSSTADRLGVPHGTTIVALTFADGVVIAGDRRATSGNVIAQRDIEKVFVTDEFSAVGIAGSAGIALEMVRLFSVDLEHYEKTEYVPLSLDGKANKLAGMVRQNLGAAMQGFVVVPLFAGYDTEAEPAQAGRIVTFDPTGGRYDEHLGFHAVGSGSVFAKSSLKKLYDAGADLSGAVRTAVEALYDAADDDTATGGPDTVRKIYPVVVAITAEGAHRREEPEIAAVVDEVIAGRRERPGGPR
ncbi:proteasome subunit beta [Pseudonocardia phyllosphaerae]|uniref:proteasome subunit beta n=1 Tax=Pseudonocardia phyllosphaerae TaxID=3390502 RepID=UPI00397E115C